VSRGGSISNCPAKVCLNSSMKQNLCVWFLLWQESVIFLVSFFLLFSKVYECGFIVAGAENVLRTPKSGLVSPGEIALL